MINNINIYISLQLQELSTCKRIVYEFDCEELIVVKSKSKFSCTSAIYFKLGADIIKEKSDFDFLL